ncbi:hypothetical protein ABZ840_03380 [Streptomyces sp. NPDC047117]|uniref:hypothetical protein n=1 Tax=Streptomyces sp. NPDC047117 TaxID=3155379 RepID=UPI0033D92B14
MVTSTAPRANIRPLPLLYSLLDLRNLPGLRNPLDLLGLLDPLDFNDPPVSDR